MQNMTFVKNQVRTIVTGARALVPMLVDLLRRCWREPAFHLGIGPL
jgi:hypothetical protein